MIKEITATGKDLSAAKENAVLALGAAADADIKFELLDLGTRGIFGIGARPAKVRAYIELPDAPEARRAAPAAKQADRSEVPAFGEDRPKEPAAGNGNRRGNRNRRGRGGRQGNRPERESNARRRAEIEEAVRDAKTKSTAMRSVVIPESELTFEPLTVADGENRTYDFIRRLLADMGIEASIALYSCSDGTQRITITGEAASALIGHHGDTLDALQYLANLAGAQKNINGEKNKTRVTIDIEGYRAKREETLRALARRMAEKALRNHRSVMLEPMSAYERRIIHSEVQSIEGVSTNSIGSDSNRKIVIYLTDKAKDEAPVEEADASEETIAEEVSATEVPEAIAKAKETAESADAEGTTENAEAGETADEAPVDEADNA